MNAYDWPNPTRLTVPAFDLNSFEMMIIDEAVYDAHCLDVLHYSFSYRRRVRSLQAYHLRSWLFPAANGPPESLKLSYTFVALSKHSICCEAE